MSGSVLLGPIVTASPAHAACIMWFGQCNNTPPTTAGPTPTTSPPVAPPPAPTVPAPTSTAVSPEEAATMFFDAANVARAAVGLPALAWREDVALMATSHSVDMAQQGAIFHGDFVSDVNLKTLNAHSLGENVGTGAPVDSIQAAFMASEHHRDNILDPGFNQVGIGVVTMDGTIFVTEDFLEAKGGPVTARPKPVARPATSLVAAPRPVRHAAPRPKAAAAPAPPSAPVTVAAAVAAPTGVVTAVPSDFEAAPREATPAKLTAPGGNGTATLNAWRMALLGALVVLGTTGGHLRIRRRRQQA